KLGFMAIWLQWVENVIWYPTILSFIATTFAYLINPDLAENKIYIVFTILFTFWIMTYLNFFGMKLSGAISAMAAVLGTIIPITLIGSLGVFWLFKDYPSQINFSWHYALPSLSSWNDLVLFSGVLFSLAGLEMTAVHAKNARDPKHDYPKGIFLSAIIILILEAFGALAIAMVVPQQEIQLAAGGMEAFTYLFQAFHLSWAIPFIAAMMTFGALGMMSTWIAGPSRGLWATAAEGDLPLLFHKLNKHEMPVHILITQALIVTALSTVFLFTPSINNSYWILLALASILYMIMYILLFISALVLRYKQPHIERIYKVPGGQLGMWITCLLGLTGSAFGCIIGFFPPSQLERENIVLSTCILVGASFLFCILPFLIYPKKYLPKQ
ncbi:MAG: APC family permease, partial [Chlamydiales bacterium]|nr:APC family permease [Chlamydiales bacterium]